MFNAQTNGEVIEGAGIIIKEYASKKNLILIKDVFIGDSDHIGQEIIVFDDEIFLNAKEVPMNKYEPRKLKYHE